MTDLISFTSREIKRRQLEKKVDNALLFMGMTKDKKAKEVYADIINQSQKEYYDSFKFYYMPDTFRGVVIT